MGVTKMNCEQIKLEITKVKKQIEQTTLSAMDALRSQEFAYASRKVNELLDLESSLEDLKQSYENQLINENNW